MTAVPILTYHNIGNAPSGARLRGLYLDAGTFRRQMRFLRILGFRGISMSEGMPYLREEKQGRVVVITFDDGYVDTLDAALPVLRSFGFTATTYVVSRRMGGHNAWDEAELNARKPLMSPGQVREWSRAGMEVGSHSRTHVHLTTCSDAELLPEVHGSKSDLEELLACPVTQFCYPYGDHDGRVVTAVRQAGFHAAVTTARGRARRSDDPLRLRRVSVSGRNPFHLFALKILTSYEDRRG